jgi:predicted transcriptional regulator
MADAAAGRVIPHAQAVAEMREVIEEAKRRKAARG